MTKQEFRNKYKAIRAQAASGAVRGAQGALLVQTSAYREADVVMTYMSFGSEADTLALARRVLADGKRLCVPVCEAETHTITPAAVTDLDGELRPGHYGILEPVHVEPVNIAEISLVVVPGLAFDREGYRVGYGGGYYDRFLPRLPHGAVTAGFTYDACVTDCVPRDAYDMPVDMVITQSGIRYRRHGR